MELVSEAAGAADGASHIENITAKLKHRFNVDGSSKPTDSDAFDELAHVLHESAVAVTAPPARGPSDTRGTHAELRICRAKTRALAGEGLSVEATLAAVQREADEHGKQRRWLEKKLGDTAVKLGAFQAELDKTTKQVNQRSLTLSACVTESRARRTLTCARCLFRQTAQLVAEKEELTSTLEKERIRIVEFEKAALLFQRSIAMAADREDVQKKDVGLVRRIRTVATNCLPKSGRHQARMCAHV